MKYIFCGLFLFSHLIYAADTGTIIPTEAGQTLVVGCVRGPGNVDPVIRDIVKQDEANFSHTTSFPTVVSTDIGPCRTDQEHIEGDWFTLEFRKDSYERVIFEWFPSCWTDFRPYLFPAIRKAFDVLRPGGELIIDHMPFTISLPSDWKQAIEDLRRYTINPDILMSAVLSKLPKKQEERYSGIVSLLLQENDPFTISISGRERADIREFMLVEEYRIRGEEVRSEPKDTQSNQEAFKASLECLRAIFGKAELEIIEELKTKIQTNDKDQLLNMFEWVYGMHSRGPRMIAALESIGFVEPTITYHEVNPYNQRHHAWIIKAYKPG